MYNNPYNYYPYMNIPRGINPYMQGTAINGMENAIRPRMGLFKGLSNIKWGTILNNTQKTLNVINQAIPVYYQLKPIASNLKSFSSLMRAFNEPDEQTTKGANREILSEKKENSSNQPTFFIN